MKAFIIPTLATTLLLGTQSCKSVKASHDLDGPAPDINSADTKGEKTQTQEDGKATSVNNSGESSTITTTPGSKTTTTTTPDGTSTTTDSDGTQPNPPDVNAPDAFTATNSLTSGQTLNPGQSITSTDGRFTVIYQQDGNLVLYYIGRDVDKQNNHVGDKPSRALWASGTYNTGGVRASFQSDGNLVVYKDGNQALWASNTAGSGAARAQITNQGAFVLYDKGGKVLWSSNTGGHPPAKPSDTRPVAVGKWSSQIKWPVIPIHTVLMPNGKVLSFGTDKNGEQTARLYYDIWNPSQGTGTDSHFTLNNTYRVDSFCGSPIILPSTGNVLISGGDMRDAPNTNAGIKDTLFLRVNDQGLERGPNLSLARWYATSTTLPSGEVMIYGGVDGTKNISLSPEVYTRANNSWRTLIGASNSSILNDNEAKWWYPRNFVNPVNGKVFGMSGDKMYEIDPAGSGTITDLGNLPGNTRDYISTAVMYDVGKILQAGGDFNGHLDGRGSDQAITVDISSGKPVVSNVTPMAYDRIWATSTVLPSGEVLITGGSGITNELTDPVLTAEMWSPKTKTFRPLSSAAVARLYHSTALLLPDASVLVGGGGAPGPLVNLNAEIYYPPYLFDTNGNLAARPAITNVASKLDYNQKSEVNFAGSVSKVVLIKTGAVTHSFNFEQRYIPLDFTVNGSSSISVTMPKNANIATPGYYHLFLIDNKGVPSVSRIVGLGT